MSEKQVLFVARFVGNGFVEAFSERIMLLSRIPRYGQHVQKQP